MVGPDGQPAARVDRDRRAPRFSWTPAYEATFRSLCESVQLGPRENSSFKAEAWKRAAQALQESHGAYPAKSHLINKSDNAYKRFRLWRGLRKDPDFLYNPVSCAVTTIEDAWRAHIEVSGPSGLLPGADRPKTSGSRCPAPCAGGSLTARTLWRFSIRTSSAPAEPSRGS